MSYLYSGSNCCRMSRPMSWFHVDSMCGFLGLSLLSWLLSIPAISVPLQAGHWMHLTSSLASFFNHGAMGIHDVLFLGSRVGGEYERFSLFSPSHVGLQVQAAPSSLPFAEICFPPPPTYIQGHMSSLARTFSPGLKSDYLS